jgi:hypothetical protein
MPPKIATFLPSIITGDEIGVGLRPWDKNKCCHNRRQSPPKLKKARQVHQISRQCWLLSLMQWVCTTNFLPKGNTEPSSTSRCSLLEQPHKWSSRIWLLHNNVPCHAAPKCYGTLGQAQHPSGSPSTSLTRSGPLWLPLPLAEEHSEHEDVVEIQMNIMWHLQAIPKQAYLTCTAMWKDCWNCYIQSGGLYFEGENLCFSFLKINSVLDIFDQPLYMYVFVCTLIMYFVK